jgi:hypothetical protein
MRETIITPGARSAECPCGKGREEIAWKGGGEEHSPAPYFLLLPQSLPRLVQGEVRLKRPGTAKVLV